MSGKRVFLSHSSKEKEEVQGLRKALADRGIDAREDVLVLRVGDGLAQLEKAIREADGFVLLLSPLSIGSEWVQKEVAWALAEMAVRPSYRVMVLLRGMDEPVLKLLFGVAVPIAIKFPEGTLPQEAATGIAQALELVPSDLTPKPDPRPVAPMAELILDFSRPSIHDDGGKRRGAAQLTVRYVPAEAGKREVRGAGTIDFVSPLGPIEAEDLRWYVEVYPRWPFGPFRDMAREVEEALPRWGRALFEAIRPKQERAIDAFLAPKGSVARRITVRVDDGGEDASAEAHEAAALLLGLPWELLADEDGYLFEGTVQARVRRMLPSTRVLEEAPEPRTPVRVLMVIARPEEPGVSFLDPRASALPLVEALIDLGPAVELDILLDGSLPALRAALVKARDEDKPYQVVHFDGHGVYDPKLGLGLLCFENDDDARDGRLQRRAQMVEASRLGDMLRDARVPLFVLDACQTAKAEEDPQASVAAELLRKGVVSVVAMRHAVLVPTASKFVEAFYGALAKGERVGTAMVRAQHALRDAPGRIEFGKRGRLDLQDWMVPVLFQEEQDPRIFPDGIDMRSAAVEARRQEAKVKRGELPEPPRHGFVGRARALLEIERRLRRSRWLTILGAGGQGKTALATEAARWMLLSRRCERVAFVSVERLSEARAVLDVLGRQLKPGYSVATAEGTGSDEEKLRRAMLPVIGVLGERRTVIVVDNWESILPVGGKRLEEGVGAILGLVKELAEVGETRVLLTSREAIPAPLDGNEMRLGALSVGEAKELLAGVIKETGKDPPRAGDEKDEALEKLIEAVGGHARSLVLLGPRVVEKGVRVTTEESRRAMEEIEKAHPGEREKSLLASVRVSLDRLDAETRRKVRGLGVFRRAAHVKVLADVLGVGIEEALEMGGRLMTLGLAEADGPYLLPDPALGAALLGEMELAERGAAQERWREGMVALAENLHRMLLKDAQGAASGTVLSLVDLLEALDALGEEVAAGRGAAEEAIEYATMLEQLISRLGVPRALEQVHKRRQNFAQRLTVWSRARFLAESAEVRRSMDVGALGRALALAKALVGRTEAAGGDVYPGAPYDQASAWFELGRVLGEGNRCEEALEALAEAQKRFHVLAEAGSQKAAHMVSVTLADQGDALAALGRLPEAEAKYEQSIRMAEERGNRRQMAVGRGQLAFVYLRQGRLPEALAAYGTAREEFAALGEPGNVAVAWHQIGTVRAEAGHVDAAEAAYQQALAIQAELGDRRAEAGTLGQLGSLYLQQGRLAEAAALLNQAATSSAELGYEASAALLQSNLGAVLRRLGRLDEARAALQAAIAAKTELGYAADPWRTWAELANVERDAKRPAEAVKARQKAIESYRTYRTAGGAPTGQNLRNIVTIGHDLRTAGPEAARADLLDPAQVPAPLQPLLRALHQIVDGNRDPALADDPALDPFEAVELSLLLDSLRAP